MVFSQKLGQMSALCTSLKPLLLCASLIVSIPALTEAKDHDLLSVVPSETSYILRLQGSANTPDMNAMGIPKDMLDKLWGELERSPDAHGRLFGTLLKEFFQLSADGKFNTIGLDTNTMEFGIYGLGLWPVVSVSLSNRDLFRDWLFGYMTKMGVQIKPWPGKDNVYDLMCDPGGKLTCVLAFDGHRMNVSFSLNRFTEQMIGYLSGTTRPERSLKSRKTLLAMAQNASAGHHNQGWLSVLRIVKTLLGKGQGLNQTLLPQRFDFSKKLPPECISDYLSMVNAMPDIYMGQREHQVGKPLESRTLWRFTGKAAEVSNTLSASDVYTVPTNQGLVSLMFTVNVQAWLQAAQSMIQSMVQDPYKCPQLSSGPFAQEQLQKALMMMQFVPPFARGIKGLSVNLLDVKMVPGGMPKVDALVILTADQAPMLLNLLKSRPQFKDFVMPITGAPASVIKGLPLPPPVQGIKIKVTQNGIGLALGDQATKALEENMKSVTPGPAPMIKFNYRVSEIMNIVSQAMTQFKGNVDPMLTEFMKSSIQQVEARLWFNGKGLNGSSVVQMK
jgi:hypothetical protein